MKNLTYDVCEGSKEGFDWFIYDDEGNEIERGNEATEEEAAIEAELAMSIWEDACDPE